MKNMAIILTLFYSSAVFSAENTVSNVLNNNTGTVGGVTINQSNAISNDHVVSEQKINDMLEKALNTRKNGGSQGQVKEANQITTFVGLADEVNKMQATNQQKNQLCKSRAKVAAEVLGYQLGFIFGKCDEVF